MINRATFERFETLLSERFAKRIFTTEDSIRYLFFLSIIESKVAEPNEIILEMKHPKIERAQIDIWIERQGCVSAAVEFKYDRPIPSERNAPRTQKAGKVFNDLRRLTLLEANSWFVYVTDNEMAGYFGNAANGLVPFFSSTADEILQLDNSYFERLASTFVNSCGGVFSACVRRVVAKPLPNGHHLRAYQVASDVSKLKGLD